MPGAVAAQRLLRACADASVCCCERMRVRVCADASVSVQRRDEGEEIDKLRQRSWGACLEGDQSKVPRSDDANLCSICMEYAVTITLTSCNHSLCGGCARKLLSAGTASACQCPFCRTYIRGFAPCQPKKDIS